MSNPTTHDDNVGVANPVPESAHPFQHSTGLLEVLREDKDKIDIEAETQLYEDLINAATGDRHVASPPITTFNGRPPSPSIFSRESIWLNDTAGESPAFTRDVSISGWTHVGDQLGGAYVVYDCCITSKEDTIIHIHKRYSAFEELHKKLKTTLPSHLIPSLPSLPPKTPLARYRTVFLSRRRALLQAWLSEVLLHPDIGGSKAVREWVTQ